MAEGDAEEGQAVSRTATRECPFCAETIKAAAVLCRFCGQDLSSTGKDGVAAVTGAACPSEGPMASPSGPELGLRLAAALGWFWFLHVHRCEGVQWLEQLLALPPGAPTVPRVRALDAAGLLAVIIGGTPEQARQRWEESLVLSQQLGYELGIASALKRLAHYEEGHDQRVALGEESIALARGTGDRLALLDALIWFMHLIDRRRDRERLRALVEEVMEIAQGLGSCFGMAMAYRFQGGHAWDEGDLPTARRCLGEELARIGALKDWVGVCGQLGALVRVTARQGDYQWAGYLQGIRERLGETTGLGASWDRTAERARLAAESGAPSEDAFAAACAEGQAMSLQQAIDYALEGKESGS